MTAPGKLAVRAEGMRLQQALLAAGAVPVEADILQPAGLLLDLYGEDIRARAYVTHDPVQGEMMLRPDFTLPVVQAHMAGGADPARYTYLGEVFRKQDHLTAPPQGRASEYLQLGYEVFDRSNPAAADAEVFALFAGMLAPLGLRAATGDIGILLAAVQGLRTSERRRAALVRHIWRPNRFLALLNRFAGRVEVSAARARMLAAFTGDPMAVIAGAGVLVGKRSAAEIAARIAVLQDDATLPPIPPGDVALLEDILAVRSPSPDALAQLQAMAAGRPLLVAAVARMADRLEAMAALGIDVAALDFAANYGRTTLEYYDGFVFGFSGDVQDMPAVATGGRYDAMTRVLGGGGNGAASIPAVGGVIRPALVLALRRGQA